MNIVTSTDLRTKTPQVIAALRSGETIDLVHRSRIVGEITPAKKLAKILTDDDVKTIINLARKLHLPKLTDKKIESRYRKYLQETYGADIS